MSRRLISLPVLFLLLVLSACGEKESIPFDAFGLELELYLDREYEQGITTLRFRLEHPVAVQQPGYAVSLTGEAFPRVFDFVVLDDGVESARRIVTLPSLEERAQIRLIVAPGRFDGFMLQTDEIPEGFRIDGAGIAESAEGIVFADPIVVDPRVKFVVNADNPNRSWTFGFDGMLGGRPADGIDLIALRYRVDPEPQSGNEEPRAEQRFSTVEAVTRDGSGRSRFELVVRPGSHAVYLHPTVLGFSPERITVVAGSADFDLESITLTTVNRSLSAVEVPEPLPADLGMVFDYPRSQWRRDDYELFRWSRYPDLLIMDTASYEVQARYLKRLAFFVEKAGTTGSLLTNRELSGAHGWNAHDYRVADLARFFNQAERSDFTLNDEEYHLLDILVETGLLERTESGLVGTSGGILSISQESDRRLRRLFLVHEAYHGIFFVDERFRQAVFSVWNSLASDEQRFWKLLLAWRYYNIKDEYLVVNEFQAYVLQQPVRSANPYFVDFIIPRMIADMPAHEMFLRAFLVRFPDSFTRSASVVQDAAYRHAGTGAGGQGLFDLVPVDTGN